MFRENTATIMKKCMQTAKERRNVKNMKVLVTGVKGQLGYDLMKELKKRGHTAVGVDVDDMDITDAQAVERVLKTVLPDIVIHCAAWTAVDLAEDPSNRDAVYNVNVRGTEHIARVCKQLSCKMIYISTEYVFDGTGTRPWIPEDLPNPLNVYAQTKYEGELAVKNALAQYYIVRISWFFGVNGKNFVKTMLQLGKTKDTITVVNDQIGSPTYSCDLAKLLVDMAETDKYGIYHASNEGNYISWYDFACEIMRQAAAYNPIYEKVSVVPVDSSSYPAKAKRPSNSRMDKSKLSENGFSLLPVWQDALARYLAEIAQEIKP